MQAEFSAAALDVHRLYVSHQHDQMRDADGNESDPLFAVGDADAGVDKEASYGLHVDLGLIAGYTGRDYPGVGPKTKAGRISDSQLNGNPGTAQRCVAAQLGEAPISVEICYPK